MSPYDDMFLVGDEGKKQCLEESIVGDQVRGD